MTITRQLQRRGTSSAWALKNETPKAGEIIFETDTRRSKLGDGVTPYNSLPYLQTATTQADVGLGNVDNTSDANKPVSTAQAAAIAAAVAGILGGAIPTLDTLAELGAAINQDPAYYQTVNSALALKAPLASPAFTGTPTVPTAAADTNTTQAASTAFVIGQASSATPAMDGSAAVGTSLRYARADHVHPTDTSRAPLASPTFTGVPAAPTAAAGTNTTQLATTAFVRTEVANLVASAPGALDTLNELANALGGDANFATTVTNALALKAPLASPALTGVPTAPTAAGGTNTTQLSTTAFVQGELSTYAATVNAALALKAPLASPSFTGNVSTTGNLQVGSGGYVHAGGFGRLMLPAGLQIGSGVSYAGLYGPTLTYNAKIVGGVWKSIGGGVASAITMDEGIIALWNASSVGANDIDLTWSARVIIGQSGNVGLGTTTPGARLDLGYIGGSVALRISRDSTNRLDFYQGGGVTYIDASAASSAIAFALAGTEQGRFASTGRFGLNTTNPAARLHSVDSGNYTLGLSGASKGLRVEHSSTETTIRGVDSTLTTSYQPLHIGASVLSLRTNGATEAVFIDESQNVGIGTQPEARLHANCIDNAWAAKFTSPSGRLRMGAYLSGYAGAAIESTNAAENAYAPLFLNGSTTILGSGGAGRIWIRSDADIGIGSSTSLYPGSGRQGVNINGGVDSILALNIGGAGAAYLFAHASGTQLTETRNFPMTFVTNGATRLYLGADGNVGVGLTTPVRKLDVMGDAAFGFDGVNSGARAATLINYSTSNGVGKWIGLSFLGVSTGSASREGALIQCAPDDADWTAARLAFYARRGGAIFDGMELMSNGGLWIANAGSTPTTQSGGGVLYVEAGALKWKGSSGTVTVLGPA